MDTSICSLNVRGLGNKTKREQVFHWLKDQPFSIYLLQETHLNSQCTDTWESEWGNKSFFSGTANNSEGVCILFNNSFKYDTVNHTEIVPGRLHVVDIKSDDIFLKVINIYGPNKDEVSLFEKLEEFVLLNDDKSLVIGGDFNTF